MRAFAWLAICSLAACGPSIAGDDDGGDDDGGPCTAPAQRCSGATLQSCSGGDWVDVTTCPMACDADLGCVVCRPGTGTCNGDTAHECMPDGSGYHDVYCDPLQGMSCGASGTCEGACSPTALGQTYFGCEYYATITGNPVETTYHFAVAVSNTTNTQANVHVEGGALAAPETFTVPANASVIHHLPWVSSLKLCGGTYTDACTGGVAPASATQAGGAYHLRTDVPVTVYQFNALEYTLPNATMNSYSNDASLLFPTTAWRTDHVVAAYENLVNLHPSHLTVTASEDTTTVTIVAKGNVAAEGGTPAFAANTAQQVTLNRGDVMELGTLDGDMTGSRVTSDKPVQVIGGHYCADVPDADYCCCDHMEEVMLPIEALGAEYVINAPAVTTIPAGKEQQVRIIATEPNTTLTYDPPQAGAPAAIANAGDFVQIARQAASYKLTANKKVMVAQYMAGSSAGGGTGDPAMALAVPIDQFRTEYLFHAPTNYDTNYVDITAPVGASVTLDGAAVTAWQPIGASGWQLARITPLGPGPNNDGNHLITGDQGFGISVYGYGMDTSYWYPGGLDLKRVVVE